MNVENLYDHLRFNYNLPSALKPEQINILNNLIHTITDVIAILPQGYGKSLPYVVAPLILDQVF